MSKSRISELFVDETDNTTAIRVEYERGWVTVTQHDVGGRIDRILISPRHLSVGALSDWHGPSPSDRTTRTLGTLLGGLDHFIEAFLK
jgi:hypothetical protein